MLYGATNWWSFYCGRQSSLPLIHQYSLRQYRALLTLDSRGTHRACGTYSTTTRDPSSGCLRYQPAPGTSIFRAVRATNRHFTCLKGTNRHNREDPVDPNPSSNTEVKAPLEKGRNTGFWITGFNGSGTITSSHPTPCPYVDKARYSPPLQPSALQQQSSASLKRSPLREVEFLETFKTCNPLGDNLAGPIKVVEKVVVSEMKKAEFIFYRDTKLDLRVYRVDVYCTTRDSQTLENNSDSSGG
ncbi:hypothetical protein K449DRAFT_433689 [Hypoxylon sp. EC38]|nr:hypothetical protein K449DRAFT_433689 [Hypoxylon sp. EC38]